MQTDQQFVSPSQPTGRSLKLPRICAQARQIENDLPAGLAHENCSLPETFAADEIRMPHFSQCGPLYERRLCH
jgi:hypothetical protein